MNEIVNKFLLVGDKFMPEMHLKQPGFTYSACGPFTKSVERIEKFMSLKVLIKNLMEVVPLMNQIINWQVSFINQLFENSKKEKFIHLLETIFEVLI